MLKSETKGETPDGIGEMPVLVKINGIPFWQASGRTFPIVAGAEDPPPGDGKDGDGKPPATGDPKGGTAGTGDDEGEFDKDRALATIRKLRENERATKAQLKELEDLRKRVQEIDDKDKSEAERLRAQLADAETKRTAAEQRLKNAQTRTSIERAAQKAGAADPEDVYALLKPAEFDLDDDGDVKNADKLVKALLEAKPYLAAKERNGVPGTPRSNGTQSHGDRVKENEEKLIATRRYTPFG